MRAWKVRSEAQDPIKIRYQTFYDDGSKKSAEKDDLEAERVPSKE